ncbi:MAG: DUF3179 domain-containing (seleno)protein [Planctomycetota bacterium]
MTDIDHTPAPTPARTGSLFTWRSGGWVVALASLICLALIAWALAPAMFRLFNRPPGDGRDVASYGFDLATCLVARDTLVPATLYRDMIPVLDEPGVMPGREVAAQNEQERGKFLVSADRVIGVVIDGVARAYPLNLLNVHEIVNDTLGGVPIAVTYHWPCDSAVVLDRRSGDETLRFGHSGIVSNSNLLLYDRQPGAEPTAPQPGASLWRQLDARAVAGPAAANGRSLRIVPSELVNWATWLERHPDTTVMLPVPEFRKRYAKSNPSSYFRRGEVMFPVDPSPPPEGPGALDRILVVSLAGARRAYHVPTIEALADDDGHWLDTLGSTPLRFTVHATETSSDKNQPATVEIEVVDGPMPDDLLVIPCLWFAWHALHPDDAPAGADNLRQP